MVLIRPQVFSHFLLTARSASDSLRAWEMTMRAHLITRHWRLCASARWAARDAMDLRHGDAEEPVAAAIFVRIVDARDGGDADQKKIQHHAGRQFRWPVVGADRHHLSEATASRDRTR